MANGVGPNASMQSTVVSCIRGCAASMRVWGMLRKSRSCLSARARSATTRGDEYEQDGKDYLVCVSATIWSVPLRRGSGPSEVVCSRNIRKKREVSSNNLKAARLVTRRLPRSRGVREISVYHKTNGRISRQVSFVINLRESNSCD